MSTELSPEERLRLEVSGLSTDEILSLCYAFQNRQERLRLYLDILRRRGGGRAQFASCLICFDLARQGDGSAQSEFAYLADTMLELANRNSLAESLVQGDTYLQFLWELCQAQLEEQDPRFVVAGPEMQSPAEDGELVVLDLLSDNDFEELGDLDIAMDGDRETLHLRFQEEVERFLGSEIGVPIYDPDAGFRLQNGRDVDRVERFIRELDSFRDLFEDARGFRCLLLLFYGTHMRSRSLFGTINKKKDETLHEGLEEFVRSGAHLAHACGTLNTLHAPAETWPKMAEVIIDYLGWMADTRLDPMSALAEYNPVERLVARERKLGQKRRGQRY